MKSLIDELVKAASSCFYMTFPIVRWGRRKGLKSTGAGLVGTAAGLLSSFYLPTMFGPEFIVLVGAFLISVVVSDRAEELLGQKDDQRIVIDEWIGYLFSVAFLARTTFLLAMAFILFRIVDTWKPLGIRKLGRLAGGWGVVMDDVAGGIMVNLLLRTLPHP